VLYFYLCNPPTAGTRTQFHQILRVRNALGFFTLSIGRLPASVSIFFKGGGACFTGLEGIAFAAGIFLIFICKAPMYGEDLIVISIANSKKHDTIQFPITKQRGNKMSLQAAAKQIHIAINSARSSLEQAQSNVLLYTNELKKSEAALEAIKPLLSPEDLKFDAPAPAKSKGAKTAPAKKSASNVPKTDHAFWMSLITDTPQKTGPITEAACAKLGVTDDEGIAVIKKRMAPFLQDAARAGEIIGQGDRFDRVYFLPKK
jgi:hypothetical protein